ncbi:hypothetical protein BGX28_007408 [Mortierella sp. GBA30]|nr:hypothetical protein BGX28_007408 [Mortierella sp. GBA30]
MVLVTLPLGVLKSNSVTFSPPLPERKQIAIKRLGFGTMVKVVLYFPTCFWPDDKHFINFLPIASSIPNLKLCRHLSGRQMSALRTYMNDLANYTSLMPIHGAPILIAYAANDSAEVFGKLTDQEAMEVLVCHLSHYFEVLVKDPNAFRPTRTFMTRWNTDPFARGSYSSIPVGAHQTDLAEFEVPVGAQSIVVAASVSAHDTENQKKANSNGRGKRKPISNGHGPRHVNETRGCNNGPNALKVPLALNLRNTIHTLTNGVDSNNGRHHPHSHQHHHQQYHLHGHFGVNKISNSFITPSGPRARNNDVHNGKLHILSQSSAVPDHSQVVINGAAMDRATGPTMGGMVTVVGPEMVLRNKDPLCGAPEQVVSILSEVDPLILSRKENSTVQDTNTTTIAASAGPVVVQAQKKPAMVIKTIGVDDAVKGRIHFAGEHTTPTSFASVHGALMTGRREAAKILAQAYLL